MQYNKYMATCNHNKKTSMLLKMYIILYKKYNYNSSMHANIYD